MPEITLKPKKLNGLVAVPPDKSISHRAVIIASLAQGLSRVKNLSSCEDCLRTIEAFKSMGVSITRARGLSLIQGRGLDGLLKPKHELYLGNSGTSLRLILGVLAGQKFSCTLSGDASLSRRPMKRVIQPLSEMGAEISGKKVNAQECAPLTIRGGKLKAIDYQTPVASAQVKSAILLAALYAAGKTTVRESVQSRDHTERMLKRFGADISLSGLSVSLRGRANLVGKDVDVPGDISAAAFFLVGACICQDSQVLLRSVGLNPTRTFFLTILQKMGAEISWVAEEVPAAGDSDEPRGKISASYSRLRGLKIRPEQIPALIDELPILMVAATQAHGETVIQQAAELRVKETDRISSMVSNLTKMGADIKTIDNDIIIRGPSRLAGKRIDSFADHRTAMSMTIASLVASGTTTISDIDCVNTSFPGFFAALASLQH